MRPARPHAGCARKRNYSPRRTCRCCLPEKREAGRRPPPGWSIRFRFVPASRSCGSSARLSPPTCWRTSCSVTNSFMVFAAMHSGVACRAQRDQVVFRIIAGVTPKRFVMDLQVRHRATQLTPPSIATQYLLAQTFVRQGVQPRGSGFGTNHSQDAFSRRFSRKACCCSPGKNL